MASAATLSINGKAVNGNNFVGKVKVVGKGTAGE